MLGGRFAGVHVVPNPVHVLTRDVLTALRPQLRPGDVLLCRAEGKLTAALLPGFWSHAAMFLGSRAEVEALGLRAEQHVAKHWEQIPEESGLLGCVLEALGATNGRAPPFHPVGLVLKRRDGCAHAVNAERIVPLLNRIRKGCRPARRAAA